MSGTTRYDREIHRMVPENVRRIQESRRSSATTPIDKRRRPRTTERRIALREQGY